MKTKTKLTPNLINNCKYEMSVKSEPYYSLFFNITGEFPNEIFYVNIDIKLFENLIFENFPASKCEEITNKFYNNKTGFFDIEYCLIPITNNIFVFFEELKVTIYHCISSDLILLEKLKQITINRASSGAQHPARSAG